MRKAFEDVLSQALSPDWKVQVGSEAPALAIETSAFTGVLVTGTISGNAGLLMAPANAAMIARAFMGEPPQEAAEFGDELREAVEELLRQVFALATTALEASFEQVWIQLDKAVTVAEPRERIRLLVSSDSRPSPLVFELQISSDLASSLAASDTAPPAPAPKPAAPPKTASVPAPEESPPDLSMLAGVEVLITLRLGHRSLALREIANLTTGSVVELDESLAEPVEILVGERVIARGEIVSVDGCYGVRITETLEPHSLAAGSVG